MEMRHVNRSVSRGCRFPHAWVAVGHTCDILLDVRNEWGSNMSQYGFKVVLQVEMDPGVFYLIPGETGFLRPAGNYLWLLNAATSLRGIIYLAAYSGAGGRRVKCMPSGRVSTPSRNRGVGRRGTGSRSPPS